MQLTLDAALAENRKREALQRVEEHADPDWKTFALETIRLVAETRYEFTTDEIQELLDIAPVQTHEPRALGAVMIQAARLGLIAQTDRFITSKSVRRHRAPKRVWRSLILQGAV